jgi:membrane associated rhomboid family serine protease
MFFPLHDQNNESVKRIPIISYLIIGTCLIVHLYTLVLQVGDSSQKDSLHFLYRHGLVPAPFMSMQTRYIIGSFELIFGKKELARIRENPANEDEKKVAEMVEVENSSFWLILMPLTCIFMHGGMFHLLSNIWFFWIFSDNVEEKMGTFFFSFFYLFSGIVSSLGHAVLNPDSLIPLVGASGAISEVMGAYLIIYPKNRITTYFCPIWFFIRRIDVPAVVVLGMYLLLNFLSMTASTHGGTAFDAHISGFIIGVAFGYMFRRKKT